MKTIKAVMSRMPMMMTCGEVEETLLDYVEGRLEPYARWKFDLHIKMCRECFDYLAAYKKASALGGEILGPSSAPAPDDLPDDLIDAIVAAREAETR